MPILGCGKLSRCDISRSKNLDFGLCMLYLCLRRSQASHLQNFRKQVFKFCIRFALTLLREAKMQHTLPEIQFFWPPNIAPRKFSTPQNRHSALYPWAFTRIFHTRKKMKSGYNILSPADYQNVRSSNVLPLPNATDTTHFLLLSP